MKLRTFISRWLELQRKPSCIHRGMMDRDQFCPACGALRSGMQSGTRLSDVVRVETSMRKRPAAPS